MPNTKLTRLAEAQTKNMNGALQISAALGAVGLNIMAYGALSYVLGMVNSLQMTIITIAF